MSAQRAGTIGERLLAGVGSRDFDGIAECFAPEGLLRAVVPSGTREDVGRAAIAARFRLWLGDTGEFAVLESEATPFADLTRLRWVVRWVDPELGAHEFEQTAYADVEGDAIVALRLACSGRRPVD